MFGAVDQEFYGLVGRIALVAALLEDRLYVLFSQLALRSEGDQTCSPEIVMKLGEVAGSPGSELIKECRKLLRNFWPDYREIAAEFLDNCCSALEGRNEVVHSLWPFSKSQDIRGWRHVPIRKRQQPPDRAVEWTKFTSEQLPELLTELVRLVDQCQYQMERQVRI